MAKDILGNEIDQEGLEAFEDHSDPPPKDEETLDPIEPDFIDDSLIRDVEGGKEVELDADSQATPRQRKRNERWEKHTQKAREAEEARIEAEKEAAVLRRENELLKQMSQRHPEPIKPEIDEETELYEQQSRLYDLYNRKAEAGNITPEETKDFKRQVRDLNNKLIDARVTKRLQQQPQQDVGAQALQAQLQMQYPEIYANPSAKLYAQGLWQQAVATGSPNSVETVRKALDETARRFKYSSSAPVDDATKRRFTGPTRGKNGKTTAQPKITITKEMLQVANAAYPHITDEKARLKKWLEVHGKKYSEAMKAEQG